MCGRELGEPHSPNGVGNDVAPLVEVVPGVGFQVAAALPAPSDDVVAQVGRLIGMDDARALVFPELVLVALAGVGFDQSRGLDDAAVPGAGVGRDLGAEMPFAGLVPEHSSRALGAASFRCGHWVPSLLGVHSIVHSIWV